MASNPPPTQHPAGIVGWVRAFYDWLPAWVRHSLTSLLSLTTVLLGVAFLVIWFAGMLPAWFGTVAGGYRPELTSGTGGVFVQFAAILGTFYMLVSWVFYVVGALLVPMGWLFQLMALKWPPMHWASRFSSLAGLSCFAFPLLVLAVQMLCIWLGVEVLA